MAFVAILISITSVLVATGSFFFAVFSWAETNRPLVTARITTHSGGNMAIALDVLLENTGNRPAFDIRLSAKNEDVKRAMLDSQAPLPTDIERAFFSGVCVPVLANGRLITNSFGSVGQGAVWRAGATLPANVSYRGLGGRRYVESCTLLLADDAGFAQVYWSGRREER